MAEYTHIILKGMAEYTKDTNTHIILMGMAEYT